MRKRIWMILISVFILLLIVSPISASEDVDGDICLDTQDIGLSEEAVIDTIGTSPDDDLEEINPNPVDTADETLTTTYDKKNTLADTANNYILSDDTYDQYFNNGGSIIENTLKSGDTLIIQNLTKKKLIITLPLNLIGSNEYTMSNSSIIVERGGANSNITGLKIIAKNGANPIYLRNTENVTVKDCYIVTINFAMPIVNSNHNTIINNIIDNDLSNGHSAIVLGNSHYNNISYNYVKNGANCIYLCSYSFLDHNGGGSNNNLITYNNISGVVSSICYGIAIMGNNNTLMYNNVENTGLGIFTNGKNNTIYFNNVTNGGEGISESGTDKTLNNTIDGVLINGNQYNPTIDTTIKETIYVDGKTGNDNNIGTKDKPFKTIKAAVNYVNDKEEGTYEIIVAEGKYKENNITINNHVNLIGNGTVTLNGESEKNIIFLKQGKTLNAVSITFINGRGADGGAIYSKGNLTVKNCTFKNNNAINGNGGAIYSTYLSVKGCQFIANIAREGCDIYVESELKIDNSTFKNHKSLDGYLISHDMSFDREGFLSKSAKVNITNCNFINNNGRYNDSMSYLIIIGEGSISNCSFKNNKNLRSAIMGAKINIDNCEFINDNTNNGVIEVLEKGKISNCIFANNTGTAINALVEGYREVEVLNTEFYNNSGEHSGAIYASNAKIKNCTFVNNTATDELEGYGGAVFSYFNLYLDNSTFINNSASIGGAVYASIGGAHYSTYSNAYINNSIFIDNKADLGGGAIASYKGTISNCTFEGNEAKNGKDILIQNGFDRLNLVTGEVQGLKKGKVDINDNYWGDIESKEEFTNEQRIVNAIIGTKGETDENGNVKWINSLFHEKNLAPDSWLTLNDDNQGQTENELTNDETNTNENGNGNGNGDGNGNTEGDGEGTGNTEGNGDGNGNTKGNGDGTGDDSGIDLGDGNEINNENIDGNETSDILSDLINNIINTITNYENVTDNIETNKTNQPKTEIETNVGTYSTDPSPSEPESSKAESSSSSSSSSPGESGGHLKSYELDKVKKIEITKENIWLSILLILIFSSLFLFGFFKEKRDSEKK